MQELSQERALSRLHVEELTNLIDGAQHVTQRRRELFSLLSKEPLFKSRDEQSFLSQEDLFDRMVEKMVRFMKMGKDLAIKNSLEKAIAQRYIFDPMPINGMFRGVIEMQGTDEQREKLLPLIDSNKIMGSYAQTEMGHGSYVRGLQTTATYDLSREEFVLNTPTLNSIKWWPGALGVIGTHAVVMAKLLIGDSDHGVHAFLLQIRDLRDHSHLPGIKVGAIGPDYNFSAADNGYLILDNVRIPRGNMLMRYAYVDPDGTYSKPPMDKLMYATMMESRVTIVEGVSFGIPAAITIAVRYSVVRRQGKMTENDPMETKVLDYKTQQHKLLPLIATAYAFVFCGHFLMDLLSKCVEEMTQGNFSVMAELHATSSGLKAFCSEVTSDGVELCRLACGGHGYSQASGLPNLFGQLVAARTYEGDNTILYLQTARYLNKLYMQRVPCSELPSSVRYLGNDYPRHRYCGINASPSPSSSSSPFPSHHHQLWELNDAQLEMYRQRALRMVELASKRYQQELGKGLPRGSAWNNSSVEMVQAAKAHCHLTVLSVFHSVVKRSSSAHAQGIYKPRLLTPPNLSALSNLCNLYGWCGVVEYSGDFCNDGYVNQDQLDCVKQQVYSLLKEIRKEAVSLVDAFDFPDEVLNSCLGRYDGDVYTHLYQWAKKSPRNSKPVHDVYQKHLKGLLLPGGPSKSKL